MAVISLTVAPLLELVLLPRSAKEAFGLLHSVSSCGALCLVLLPLICCCYYYNIGSLPIYIPASQPHGQEKEGSMCVIITH